MNKGPWTHASWWLSLRLYDQNQQGQLPIHVRLCQSLMDRQHLCWFLVPNGSATCYLVQQRLFSVHGFMMDPQLPQNWLKGKSTWMAFIAMVQNTSLSLQCSLFINLLVSLPNTACTDATVAPVGSGRETEVHQRRRGQGGLGGQASHAAGRVTGFCRWCLEFQGWRWMGNGGLSHFCRWCLSRNGGLPKKT